MREIYVSLKTSIVTKTLTEMVNSELSFGSTYTRFDGNPDDHYHFVCEECGLILDLDMNSISSIDEQAARETGCRVTSHRLEFYGKCSECVKKESMPKN